MAGTRPRRRHRGDVSHVAAGLNATAHFGVSTLSLREYARDVMRYTHALWGAGRSLEEHVADVRAAAHSPQDALPLSFVAWRSGTEIAASLKRYTRVLRWGTARLRATGIGAVFTLPHLRGQGYATALLGALLDAERAAGQDVVYLFSDIGSAFYAALRFMRLPSRTLSFGSRELDTTRVTFRPARKRDDWDAIARTFSECAGKQLWHFERSPAGWDFLRARLTTAAERGRLLPPLLSTRGDGAAYVVGSRTVRADRLTLIEAAFAGTGAGLLPPLVRSACGDLRRIRGWAPMAAVRSVLPAGVLRARRDELFMATALTPLGQAWLSATQAAAVRARTDWLSGLDHV